jgi:hypothetical protein
MGSVQLSMLTLANEYLEHEFKIKGYANVFDFLKRDGYSKEILDEYIQPNKSNKFNWNDITRFFDWEGRPAVLVRPDNDSLAGFFIRASAEPGTWEAASPAEIVNSGRELSKAEFQNVFAEFFTHD